MSLFDELVFDALCGGWGRFASGTLLDLQRRRSMVPVPRNVPKSRNVHVAQVATKPKSPDFTKAFARIATIWET